MATTLHLENLPKTLELIYVDDAACLRFIDERVLPEQLVLCETTDWMEVVDAIPSLALRGAPAIGLAGAAAIALWVENNAVIFDENDFTEALRLVADRVVSTRPTAVNLAWAVKQAVDYALYLLDEGTPFEEMGKSMCEFVQKMAADDEATNRAMGAFGAEIVPDGARILTHCNAGSLATVYYGTALGVIYAATEQGKVDHVYADETRPVGQGARLTAWELGRAGVPTTLICDNMAASLFAAGRIDMVIVGADRITRSGDVANKIGTYGVAVLAKYHGVPFYVAAPVSTFDAALETGDQIPIEQRAASEVAAVIPDGVDVYNPAFDVTPAALITGIITEKGIIKPEEVAAFLDEQGA